MKEKPSLLINQSTVKELLEIKDYIEIVHKVYQGLDKGTIINPNKLTLDLGETGDYPYHDGFVNSMPAYIGWQDAAGLKFVSGFTGKRKEAGLSFINGLIILLDAQMGTFLAVMDGTHITNMRTGAQTATSLSYLVKKPSIKVGIYGAGTQARMNTLALSEIYNIEKLTVWNHRRSTAEKFVEDMEDKITGDIVIADDPKEASQADVVITVTSSQDPIVKGEWIQSGTVVYPLGSFQEIDDDLILRADKIIVDHPYQALNRGALKKLHGQGKITEETLYATLGELANDKKQIDDLSDEITICIPIGIGAVDVAVAHEVYTCAVGKGYAEIFDFKS